MNISGILFWSNKEQQALDLLFICQTNLFTSYHNLVLISTIHYCNFRNFRKGFIFREITRMQSLGKDEVEWRKQKASRNLEIYAVNRCR